MTGIVGKLRQHDPEAIGQERFNTMISRWKNPERIIDSPGEPEENAQTDLPPSIQKLEEYLHCKRAFLKRSDSGPAFEHRIEEHVYNKEVEKWRSTGKRAGTDCFC